VRNSKKEENSMSNTKKEEFSPRIIAKRRYTVVYDNKIEEEYNSWTRGKKMEKFP
jgi:hypothetical protein